MIMNTDLTPASLDSQADKAALAMVISRENKLILVPGASLKLDTEARHKGRRP